MTTYASGLLLNPPHGTNGHAGRLVDLESCTWCCERCCAVVVGDDAWRELVASGWCSGALAALPAAPVRRRAISLFSGAGGLDLGLEQAGWQVVAQCEIDPTARAVLARHWPDVPCHDDVTTFDGSVWRGRVDLVAGGSPCQDLSMAGRRAGLDGDRSGLFWEQCRVADESAARWVLWENVAGALSSNGGEDFAAVLWGLTGTWPEVPADGWRSAGVCVGHRRTAVWRLLDARWFGVAQRRRRVFVVAGPRGECGPQVLLEPESCNGGPRPSAAPGQIVAALTANGVGAGGGADDNAGQAGHLIPSLTTRCGSTLDDQQTGQLVATAFHLTQTPITEVDGSPALSTGSRHGQASIGVFARTHRANHDEDPDIWSEAEVSPTLNTNDTAAGAARSTVLATTAAMAVRRLTPRECERLMGWPDDHTRWRADGREVADSHRYRLCGNGVVAAQGGWVAQRVLQALEAAS